MLTLASASCLVSSPRAPGRSSMSTTSTSRWSAIPIPARSSASRHRCTVSSSRSMHDTPALTGERRNAADTDPGFPSDLPQPGKLSRPVFEDHCQVRGHRIFDLATWPTPGQLIVTDARPARRLYGVALALMAALFCRDEVRRDNEHPTAVSGFEEPGAGLSGEPCRHGRSCRLLGGRTASA